MFLKHFHFLHRMNRFAVKCRHQERYLLVLHKDAFCLWIFLQRM
ncbi:unnamed protein product, partial [Brugia timori]|uniref:Uncharacterized protein n=1 Tax=Brugia timori TaxID=42155 RepID=A0A0R3QC07_9BILA